MPPLRILHVTPYYADAWAYGGIPRVAVALASGLARRGHRVTVCTTDAADAATRVSRTPEPCRAGDVDVRVFRNASNRLAYRWQLFLPRGLDRFLRLHVPDFDVAHIHGCHHLPGAIAARRCRRAGVPYVLAPHGTALRHERRRFAKRLFDGTLGRRIIPDAARILAVSEAERRQLVSLGVAAHALALLPSPVDLSELEPPPERGWLRRRVRATAEEPIALYLGTLTPRKQVDVLIAAVARLGRADLRLVIAGNDLGTGSRLRRLARARGVESATTFTGLLRGRDRLRALADADVVVYPSRDEVFGLVPLEALLCGSPVIVADDSGCGDLVGRLGGGLVVRQGDAEALAAAIRQVLAAPSRWSAPVALAAHRIRRLYASDVVCAQLDDLYRELAPASSVERAGV